MRNNTSYQVTPLSYIELSIPAILSHRLQMPLGRAASVLHIIYLFQDFHSPQPLSSHLYHLPEQLGHFCFTEKWSSFHTSLATSIASLPQSLGLCQGIKSCDPRQLLTDQKVLIRLLKLPLSPPFPGLKCRQSNYCSYDLMLREDRQVSRAYYRSNRVHWQN